MSAITVETVVATYKGKTATEYRQMAQECRTRSYESYERCGSDGFLSQAASDATAREYDLQAEILDNGGVWKMQALFDLEGNQVAAKYMETRYGWSWALLEVNADASVHRIIGWFNESSAKSEKTRLAAHTKKGFYVGTAMIPCHAAMGGNWGTYCEREDNGYSPNAQIVDNGK